MNTASKTFVILAAAAFAAYVTSPAMARQGRGGDDVANDSGGGGRGGSGSGGSDNSGPGNSGSGGSGGGGAARVRARGRETIASLGAPFKVEYRDRGRDRWEVRFQMERAPEGLAPEVWLADAGGTLGLAGAMTPDPFTPGEYRLRLRSKRGDVLPGGATALADLAGRAYEVREGGEVLLAATMPAAGAKARGRGADDALVAKRRRGRGADDAPGHVRQSRGADDPAGHVRHGRGADDPAGHR